jgi:uridine phosphorylase
MLIKQFYPILEFDSNRTAVIEPSNLIKQINIPEHCVISFFREVIEKKKESSDYSQVALIRSETIDIPVYETKMNGKPICLVLGYLGAAGSAGLLEELIALGCRKFMVCGGAGVLQKDVAVGHLVLPYAAVRDEGLSYHYVEPAREIECNKKALEVIETVLNEKGIKYIKAKTWTTDAFYRETKDKVELRKSEGCVTVEMEAAAFYAVSQFREVCLGQILYGGDDLSGDEWDNRFWQSREGIREKLVDLTMEICLKL